MIYLDYAATTPMRKEVLHAFQEAAKKYYGNPSSLHDIGTEANEALELCREQLAGTIQGNKDGVYFTSGGSESNILAIRSLIEANRKKGNHLITTDAEHSSVHNLFKQLEEEGYEVTYLSVDGGGQIDLADFQNALRKDTILASIHHGNSEIGALQPLFEIGKILKEHQIIFHTDCVQSYGKVPIDVNQNYIDSLSVSSHKIYGPKGIGMCYINPRVNWKSQYKGTTHEKGFRPGTVDVPSILAFTAAAQMMHQEMEGQRRRDLHLRMKLVNGLKELSNQFVVEGNDDMDKQLPHIVGLSFLQAQGQYIMLECNRYGLAVSTGSACQVGQQSPSRTMLSMGKTVDDAKQLIRISFGKMTTEEQITQTIQTIGKVLKTL